MPKRKFDDEQDKEIAEVYLSGKSAYEIADIHNTLPKVIYRSLKRTNTPVRTNSENKRVYSVDEKTFDVIDTPEKAYWWGLLFADGSTNTNATRLTFNIKDKKHIERFKKFLNSEHPVSEFEVYNKEYNKTYRQAGITIYSQYLERRMKELGIIPHRPEFDISELPRDLYHYWILGLFDGDGTVSTSNFPRVIFCSSNRKVMEFVRDQLSPHTDKFNKKTDHKKISTHKNTSIFYLYYNGENISRAIYEYMYKDATVFLERKKKIFDKFC